MKKIISVVLAVFMLTLFFTSCGKENHGDVNTNSNSQNSSTDAISDNSDAPKIDYNTSRETSIYERITNPRNGAMFDLVGDPMEQYFTDPKYATRSDPKSDSPIYTEASFIKGTYPLDGDVLNYETARVIIIEFKEPIDPNYLNPLIQTVTIQTEKRFGKDITNQFNFSYESGTDKLLITKQSYGSGFGSGDTITITIHGDQMKTAEIQEATTIENGIITDHRNAIPRRQLSGTYSFSFQV